MVKIKFFNVNGVALVKAMKPHIDEMKKKGYPIEEIDIDENGTIANKVHELFVESQRQSYTRTMLKWKELLVLKMSANLKKDSIFISNQSRVS